MNRDNIRQTRETIGSSKTEPGKNPFRVSNAKTPFEIPHFGERKHWQVFPKNGENLSQTAPLIFLSLLKSRSVSTLSPEGKSEERTRRELAPEEVFHWLIFFSTAFVNPDKPRTWSCWVSVADRRIVGAVSVRTSEGPLSVDFEAGGFSVSCAKVRESSE